MSKKDLSISKFLSYVLRHSPEAIGLSLDSSGWALISDLISLSQNRFKFNMDDLKRIVDEDSKQRYIIDGDKIRANQGHSIDVDLKLKKCEPPAILYHGTASRFINSIKKDGLINMGRHAVHLTTNTDTAIATGKRHGDPVVLVIDSKSMFEQGFEFEVSANNVWLVSEVPPKFITM